MDSNEEDKVEKKLREKINNLKIQIETKRDLSTGRTVLFLRDLPSSTTETQILDIFENFEKPVLKGDIKQETELEHELKTDEKPDQKPDQKSDEKPERNPDRKTDKKGLNKHKTEQKVDKKEQKRPNILKIKNEYENNWSLEFKSEQGCLEAALFLKTKEINGEKVHCRVVNRLNEGRDSSPRPASFTPTSLSAAQSSGVFPESINRFANMSPIFYNSATMNYSPVFPPVGDDSILEQIRVPDGVFGDSVSQTSPTVAVSPMKRVLEKKIIREDEAVPPEFFEFSDPNHTINIEKHYRKLLKMKQTSLDRSKDNFFPKNMVKCISKSGVSKLLQDLSKREYSLPSSFRDEDGSLRHYAKPRPDRQVLYGRELHVNNPNNTMRQRIY